jgi:hypothetical protein
MNPWHLGMSFEAHAHLKEIANRAPLESKYIFLGGLNQDLIRDCEIPAHMRFLSINYHRIQQLNKKLEGNEFLDLVHESRAQNRDFLKSLESLELYEILEFANEKEGINIGRAVNAIQLALIDKEKVWKVDSIERFPVAIPLLKAYIRTYLTVRNILKNSHDITVNLFNTRFLNERAARDAVLDLKGRVIEFEQVNSRSDSFGLFSDSVHSPIERAAQARDSRNQTDDWKFSEGIPPHETWIELRKSRVLQSFTKKQRVGKLPILPEEKSIIACFLSSFDELVLAGYANSENEFTQENSLEEICRIVEEHKNWHLVIRAHPNMLTRPKSEQLFWQSKLENLNAQILLPDDEVDSYALIARSNLILTFGSTMGVEALAMGKPSLLLGQSLYSGFNLSTRLKNPSEIRKFLNQPPIILQEQMKELDLYCQFQLSGGIRFRYLSVLPKDRFEFNPTLYYQGRPFLKNERVLQGLVKACRWLFSNPFFQKGN